MPKLPWTKSFSKGESSNPPPPKKPAKPKPLTALAALAQGFDLPPGEVVNQLEKLSQEIKALRGSAAEATQKERERAMAIFHGCNTVGQYHMIGKLISEGVEEKKATDRIMEVAAAADPNIHNSHSYEGGHAAPASTAEVYAKRKAARAATRSSP